MDEAAAVRDRLRALLVGLTDEEWEEQVTINAQHQRLSEGVGLELGGAEGPGAHAAEHAVELLA